TIACRLSLDVAMPSEKHDEEDRARQERPASSAPEKRECPRSSLPGAEVQELAREGRGQVQIAEPRAKSGSVQELPVLEGRPSEDSQAAREQAAQEERRSAGVGNARGPWPEEGSQAARKQAAREERQSAGVGSAPGPWPEESSQAAQKQAARKERQSAKVANARGPWPQEGSQAAQKQAAREERRSAGVGSAPGPWPEESSQAAQKQAAREERQSAGVGNARGPWPEEGGRAAQRRTSRVERERLAARKLLRFCKQEAGDAPVLCNEEVADCDLLTPEEAEKAYGLFLILQGASGQWGRMYVVPLDEPRVCDVLDNVEITEGGQIYVSVAGAKLQSPASPCKLRAALLHLRDNHKLYKTADVSRAIQALQVALSQGAEAEAGAEPTGELQEEQLEFVTACAPSAPPPKRPELQRCRDLAQLPQNMDTKIFPHLFPTGQGGWDERMPFPRYSRSRLLGAEPRFEQDPSYVHFLLEQYYKRKISANANVRIGKLQQPSASSRQALLRSVYTTMRDIPGTQPYLFAKRGVAVSMYEQLGAPHWFMTLTCHARQEPILAACIYAKLLRDNAAQENGGRGKTAKEIRTEVASVLYNFMSHESYAWQGFSANQLCNSQPAVVARQFFHQVRQFLAWLAPAKKFDEDLCQEFPDQDEQDREEPKGEVAAEEAQDAEAPFMTSEAKAQKTQKTRPPFRVIDYIVRVEWQKRGYPHVHMLLWTDTPLAAQASQARECEDPDFSDENFCDAFVPGTVEDLCDKFISTTTPHRWKTVHKNEAMAKLAQAQIHTCSKYCGLFVEGACRFGFPRDVPQERTRLRTTRDQWRSRHKSSLEVRRREDAARMCQYNSRVLLKWRSSMDLQAVCNLNIANKYILGYTFKSEEDRVAHLRMLEMVEHLAQQDTPQARLTYKLAHAALQGRTTSTFEAAHLLLSLPIVLFSRHNVWVQVGPPETWTIFVPRKDEREAIKDPNKYAASAPQGSGAWPALHRRYSQAQLLHAEKETEVPIEGQTNQKAKIPWKKLSFFDFCAGFQTGAKTAEGLPPAPRSSPAIVGHRSFNPDLEAEEFYYSKLLLHLPWKEPGDWLTDSDGGSHVTAFRRIVADVANRPDFLKSVCFPQMDGAVEAARQLFAVQLDLYIKANMASAEDGWVSACADERKYQDSLAVMQALKDRHGGEFEFDAPDDIPSGLASDMFAPVDGGEEAFAMLTAKNPSPDVRRQLQAMNYVVYSVMHGEKTFDSTSSHRLRLIIHGAGGCGKSVVLRASAHKLRESGRGVVIAAPTGVAAFNINGVTLHTCCSLPVRNNSYGRAVDAPPPRGAQLANLKTVWSKAHALFIDELSFMSEDMTQRIDANLRLAREMPHIPFGGIHVVLFGDLYQLPPPGGLPIFASPLWNLFELCEWTEADVAAIRARVVRERNQVRPAPAAVKLYATRAAVAESNATYLQQRVAETSELVHELPAADRYIRTNLPSYPDNSWPQAEDTGGMELMLRLATGVRVMLKQNLDVRDGLVNGACGVVKQLEIAGETVLTAWVDFEKGAGKQWKEVNGRAEVRIQRTTARFAGKDGKEVERKQFPLVLAGATTIHKSQAVTHHCGVHARLDASCKQEGQAYVAMSRCPTKALFTLEYFSPKSLRFNASAEWALATLRCQQAMRRAAQDSQTLRGAARQLEELRCALLVPQESWLLKEKFSLRQDFDAAASKAAIPGPEKEKARREPRRCHAADAARLPQVYFERQERALCGLHALNNALGAKHFSSKDMVGAAELFLVENAELSDVLADHVDQENGWYSIETMCTALRAKSMQLFGKATWELSLEPVVSASQLVKATGAVQNRENHWVAYKATTRGELLLLDSLQPAAQLIAEEEFLTQLASYPGTYLIVSV
ncbi:unnamed protein product, partial [Effrenium voratum]